jgi:hypothetical protein
MSRLHPSTFAGYATFMPVLTFSAKTMLCLGLTIHLAACSAYKGDTAMSSQTFYLRNADAAAKASARDPGGAYLPKPASKPSLAVPSQPGAEATPSPIDHNSATDHFSSEQARAVDEILRGARANEKADVESFATLQTRLLKRINTLSNYQADSACLILQIIPRERVFDRSIDPRAKLLNYAHQVNSIGDLHDIENAINNPKG